MTDELVLRSTDVDQDVIARYQRHAVRGLPPVLQGFKTDHTVWRQTGAFVLTPERGQHLLPDRLRLEFRVRALSDLR
jgi:hypothetical protein